MKDNKPNAYDWTPIPGWPCWYLDGQGNPHLSIVEVMERKGIRDTPQARAALIAAYERALGERPQRHARRRGHPHKESI